LAIRSTNFPFKGFLSAYAEDYGLCPWMNAKALVGSFMRRGINASADFATGG